MARPTKTDLVERRRQGLQKLVDDLRRKNPEIGSSLWIRLQRRKEELESVTPPPAIMLAGWLREYAELLRALDSIHSPDNRLRTAKAECVERLERRLTLTGRVT